MDPLSISASVVGVLTAATQISSLLATAISKSRKAPEEMLELKTSIDSIRLVLTQVQSLLLGQAAIVSSSRTGLILVEQVIISMTACVTTFAKLDTLIAPIRTSDGIRAIDRVRWAAKSSQVRDHLHKLELQKSSLTFIFTILTCESSLEAQSTVTRLENVIEKVSESLLKDDAALLRPTAATSNQDSTPVPTSSLAHGTSDESTVPEYVSVLQASSVYKRQLIAGMSLAASSRASVFSAGSAASNLSLAEVYNIAAVTLPISAMDLSNGKLYQNRVSPTPQLKTSSRTSLVPDSFRPKLLVASSEYDIHDQAIKVKIGVHGVYSQMLSRTVAPADLLLVCPMIGNIEYPGVRSAPITIMINGRRQEVETKIHLSQSGSFLFLDAPILRAQSKAEPYPWQADPMGTVTLISDERCAEYYSTFNQCIAEAIKRYHPETYLIGDICCSLALLYLLPTTVPFIAHFFEQFPLAFWDMTVEVQNIMGLNRLDFQNYLPTNGKLDLLYLAARYVVLHQNMQGLSYVSDPQQHTVSTRGLRTIEASGLKNIRPSHFLIVPDPSDTAIPDTEARHTPTIDTDFEKGRDDLRMQAQKWAGLEVNPSYDLFVFVGRWAHPKGIDLFCQPLSHILRDFPSTQFILVGPIIDGSGLAAAEELGRLMKSYPNRMFIKPEFTSLPPCIFSGAEFAILPCRYDAWGLAAIEFGRKGALGIGPRMGGQGSMPGFWYQLRNLEDTKEHLTKFEKSIRRALQTTNNERARMRAEAASKRFPVQIWKENLLKQQRQVISAHETHSPNSMLYDPEATLVNSPAGHDESAGPG